MSEIEENYMACACVLVSQVCPTLCDPMDCSLPGSSVHGIFQGKYWNGMSFPTQGLLYERR